MDGTDDRGSSRPLKAALAALALAGLLAIVALAARGGHPGGRGRLHQREVPAWVANDLLTIVVVAYTLGAIGLVVAFMFLRDEWTPPSQRRTLRRLLGMLVIFAALALLGYRAEHGLFNDKGRGGSRQQTLVGTSTSRTPTLPTRPVANRPAQFDWVLAAAIGGGLLLVSALVLTRRRGEVEAEDETVEEELSAVVSDAIDDLRGEADPRRAVIAAYARMEGVLAQHGHPRRASEAPFEYLTRILLRLRVRAAAVRDLTELFERAKFSTHEIDLPMKERAIAALVSIRDDLQAAPA